MPDDAELMMSLGHAHDALRDQVMHFHNEMNRRGVKQMSPREWAREFQSWFNEYDFERDYLRTISWLKEREAESSPTQPPVCDTAGDRGEMPDDEPDRNAHSPQLDGPLRPRHEAALVIAVRALQWEAAADASEVCLAYRKQARAALDKIAALVPDAVK